MVSAVVVLPGESAMRGAQKSAIIRAARCGCAIAIRSVNRVSGARGQFMPKG
jgi:hypothetical protein